MARKYRFVSIIGGVTAGLFIAILGLILIFNKTLIPIFPVMLHTILGWFLILSGVVSFVGSFFFKR